jgi:glycosyltransferase involved in cell wall biosynthesis
VVDDESTDDTAAWIRGHYPQVKVLTFPNGGTSVARNRGAAAATGNVLVFIDHDDRMQPHAIATLVGMLESLPDARAAYADHTLRDVTASTYYSNHHTAMPAFHRLRVVPAEKSAGAARLLGFPLHRALLHGNLLQQPWAVYRTTFTDLAGFDPDVRYCEDWDMYLRVTARYPVAVSDVVIADHLIEGGNLHRASGQEAQHMKVLRKHLRAAPWWRVGVRRVLRTRLAIYHKAAGDEALKAGLRMAALLEYRSSFVYWPFDFVVAMRYAAWNFCRLLERGGGSDAES